MAAPRVLPDRARPLVVVGLGLFFLSALLLPRAQASAGIFWSVAASGAFLLIWIGALALQAARKGERLRVEFTPRKPHLVQIVMHSSVFAYWGWH